MQRRFSDFQAHNSHINFQFFYALVFRCVRAVK